MYGVDFACEAQPAAITTNTTDAGPAIIASLPIA